MVRLLTAVFLAILIFWAPLPFGSVLGWAHTVLRCVAFILLAVSAFLIQRQSLKRVMIPALALVIIAVLGLAQSANWRVGFVEAVSARHAELAIDAANKADPPDFVRLSLAPRTSRETALTFLAIAALLVVAAGVERTLQRRWLLWAISASALFQVLYGARHWMAHMNAIWGVPTQGEFTRLRGTFVNPDHLALYLEMALAVVFAWLWIALRRAQFNLSAERRLALIMPPVLLWLTLVAAIAFTGSRAGLAIAMVATIVQGLLLAMRVGKLRTATAGLSAVCFGLLFVAALGVQAGFGRWLATSQHELTWNGRLLLYSGSIELWQQFPLFGTGLGSFLESFTMVQPEIIDGTVRHAHNDYLEILATTGLLGFVVFAIGSVFLGWRLFRALIEAQRSETAAAALAALGAFAAVALHSVVDFGMAMPANAATFVVICGVALGASNNNHSRS